MEFIVVIMLAIQALCIGFCIFCIKLTNNKNIDYLSKFLKKFIITLIVVLAISYLISIAGLVKYYIDTALLLVVLVKSIIEIFFLVTICTNLIKFYNNLINDVIFSIDNSQLTKNNGKAFLYYALVEAIGGIVFTVFNNMISSDYGFNYTILISSSFFIYIFLGVVFYLISILFDRSIEIYEENKLTIW